MSSSVAPAPPADAATGAGGGPDTVTASGLPRLFDPDAPTARQTDPETSRGYGRGHPSRNPQCARVLLVIARYAGHGATCADVVSSLRSDRGNTARRIKDLRDIGAIETSPRTRMSGAGKPQHIHHITAEGSRLVPAARQLLWEVS